MALRYKGQSRETQTLSTPCLTLRSDRLFPFVALTIVIFALAFLTCVHSLSDVVTSLASNYHIYDQHTSSWLHCPTGWTLKNGYCYNYSEVRLTWTQAEAFCNSKAGRLISIRSQTEQNFISKFVREFSATGDNILNDGVWIGLVYHTNKSFYWSDGQEAVEQEGFWAANGLKSLIASPNSKHCCYINASDHRWALTSSCDKLFPSLCVQQPCEIHAVRCEDGSRCINRAWFCDGQWDCKDGSDELECHDASIASSALVSRHCGGIKKDASGSLLSPNFPGDYPPFSNCIWKIEATPPKVLEIWVETLVIEKDYDSLKIFDGLEMSDRTLQEHLDGNVSHVKVISTSSFVSVKFASDHSIEYKGFNISWQAVEPKAASCGGVLNATKFRSNFTPSGSSTRVFWQHHCDWLISSSSNTVLNIVINSDFELKSEDKITIYDGPDSQSQVIAHIYPTHVVIAPRESQTNIYDPLGLSSVNIPPVIVSSGSHMLVHISIESKTSSSLFSFSEGCDAYISSNSSLILSPGYASFHYVNNLNCTWLVPRQKQGKDNTLRFLSNFYTEASNDYVQVRNSSTILLTLSGIHAMLNYTVSASEDLSIQFVSDSTVNKGRWAAIISYDCDDLTLLPPMTLNTTATHFGTVVKFLCPENYLLLGAQAAVCGPNGEWLMAQMPSCQKISCGPAPAIPKGYLVHLAGTEIGHLAKYACFHGYRMLQSDIAVCRKGVWENVPVCTAVTCPKEPPPFHGLALAEYITFGYVREYFCEDNFHLIGSKFSHCNVTGQWSSPVPTCQASNCPNLSHLPPHSKINTTSQSIDVGQSILITCSPGYALSGPNLLTCLPSLQYDVPVPVCVDVDECLLGGHICGSHLCQNVLGGYHCFCRQGFHHDNNSTQLCVDVDECQADNGGCSDICNNTEGSYDCLCSPPASLYQGPNERRQGLALYSNRTCLETCESIPHGNGMLVVYSQRPLYNGFYPVSTVAYVQCPGGYYPTVTNITCVSQLLWSSLSPQCLKVECPKPVPPANGSVNFTSTLYSSLALYQCLCGYELLGQSIARCRADGQWSSPIPVCQAHDCPDPRTYSNATLVGDEKSFSVGTSVRFRCDKPGFTLTDNSPFVCKPKKPVLRESELSPVATLSMQIDMTVKDQAQNSFDCVERCASKVKGLFESGHLGRVIAQALNQNVHIYLAPRTSVSSSLSFTIEVTVHSGKVGEVCRYTNLLKNSIGSMASNSIQDLLNSCSTEGGCPLVQLKDEWVPRVTESWSCLMGLRYNNKTCGSSTVPACLEDCISNQNSLYEEAMQTFLHPINPDASQTEFIIASTMESTVRMLTTIQTFPASTLDPESTGKFITPAPELQPIGSNQENLAVGSDMQDTRYQPSFVISTSSPSIGPNDITRSNDIAHTPTRGELFLYRTSPRNTMPTAQTAEPKAESPDSFQIPLNSRADLQQGDGGFLNRTYVEEGDLGTLQLNVTAVNTSCANVYFQDKNGSRALTNSSEGRGFDLQLERSGCITAGTSSRQVGPVKQEQPSSSRYNVSPLFTIYVTDSMSGSFSNISCVNATHFSINTKVNEILREFTNLTEQQLCLHSDASIDLFKGEIKFMGTMADIYINFSMASATSSQAQIESCASQFQEFTRRSLVAKFGKVDSEVIGAGCDTITYTGSRIQVTLMGWSCLNDLLLDETLFQCLPKYSKTSTMASPTLSKSAITSASFPPSPTTPFLHPEMSLTPPCMRMDLVGNFTVIKHQELLHSHCIGEYNSSINKMLDSHMGFVFRNFTTNVNVSLDKVTSLSFGEHWVASQSTAYLIPLQESVNVSTLRSWVDLISHEQYDYSTGFPAEVPGCPKISLSGLKLLTNTSSNYVFNKGIFKCIDVVLPELVTFINLTFQGHFPGNHCEKIINSSAEAIMLGVVSALQLSIVRGQICGGSKEVYVLPTSSSMKITQNTIQVGFPLKLVCLEGNKQATESCYSQLVDSLSTVLVSPSEAMIRNISKACQFSTQLPSNYTIKSPKWKCLPHYQYSPSRHMCESTHQISDSRENSHFKRRHKRETVKLVRWSGPLPQCIDVSPPKFTDCPGLTKVLTLNQLMPVQVINLPVVSDNSGKIPIITYNQTSFKISSPLPKKYLLTIKATDNAGLSSTCNIWFSIKDEIPPDLVCPDSVTLHERVAGSTYRVDYSKLNLTVSDNSGNVTLTFFPPNNSEIPLYQNMTVTVIAADESGNSKACFFNLFVTPVNCFEDQLSLTYGMTKNCSEVKPNDQALTCSMYCPNDKQPRQTIFCTNGSWNEKPVSCSIIDGCSPGFYSMNASMSMLCMECEIGEYQTRYNATSCDRCLPGYSTAFKKSTSSQDCIAICKKNEFSVTGLVPCQPCPFGFHQPNNGSKSCEICKGNESYCRGNCPVGSYYTGQSTSCKRCPLNFYSEVSGSLQCTPCPHNKVTKHVGAKSSINCTQDDYEAGHYCHNCTCTLNQSDVSCICQGSVCTPHHDPCTLHPCRNNGLCHNNRTEWGCLCPPGYTGKFCDKIEQTTRLSLGSYLPPTYAMECDNRGTYDNSGSNITCLCLEGFSGKHCEYNIDDCKSNYCLNGASCIDSVNSFTCKCLQGFTGAFCEIDIDNCFSSPCQHNGLCRDLVDGYLCHCQPGYTGVTCDTLINPCESALCDHGATCVYVSESAFGFHCQCSPSFTGVFCEVEIDNCDPMPCSVNGTKSCLQSGCSCLPNWQGELCDRYQDPCYGNPCGQEDVICLSDSADSSKPYFCLCPPNVSHPSCLPIVDMCSTSPCLNSGFCVPSENNYTCQCSEGYFGSHCESNIDDCRSHPCQNNGSCRDGVNQFFCQCQAGYAGEYCEIDIDECLPLPCLHGGNCTQLAGGYICTCTAGFKGQNCEVKVNQCEKQPCHNNGVCQELESGIQCECLPGYSGALCETSVSQCHNTSKCLNGAQCHRLNSEDVCQCTSAFTGPDCKKAQTSNFDVHFDGSKPAALVVSPLNVDVTADMSLCLWVNIISDSTYLSLESDHGLVLSLRNLVGVPSIVFNESIQLNTQDGSWHHICLVVNVSSWAIYLDGQNRFQGVLHKWTLASSSKLTIGQRLGMMDEEHIQGLVSDVNVYSSALTHPEVVSMFYNCQYRKPGDLFNWVTALSSERNDGKVVMPSQCGQKLCTSELCSLYKETTDKIPPMVESCPGTKIETSPLSPVAVSWEEPVFTDNVAVVRVMQNYRPGQLFPHDSYRVVYLAYDAENNSAECSFDLFVRKSSCIDPPPPQSGSRVCHDWRHGRYCIPSCMAMFQFVSPAQNFIRCGQEGVWDPVAEFPGCAGNHQANYTITGHILLEGPTCGALIKQKLGEKLATLVQSTCGADHMDCWQSLVVECSNASQVRHRRQAGGTGSGLYNVTMEIRAVPNIIYDVASPLNIDMISEKIIQGVKRDMAMNLTLTSVQFKTSRSCLAGQTLQDGSCVDCLSGYYVSEGVCRQCPKGCYTDAPLQTICIPCPDGLTTATAGASHSSQCLGACDAGHFYNDTTTRCEACPLAHYQNNSGQWECNACPPGFTTKQKGATSAIECLDQCGSGEELGRDGVCNLCAIGTFRDENGSSPFCIPCAPDWTTETSGSTSESQCNVVRCNKGHYKNLNNQTCHPCSIGTFQPNSGEKSCLPCGIGMTTENEGADRKELCIKSKITTEHSCKDACIQQKSCDDSSQSRNCRCDMCQNSANSDDSSLTLLIVSMLLAILAIFTIFVVVTICVHRKNKKLKIKNKIKMYREDRTRLVAFTNQAFDSCPSGSGQESMETHLPTKLATRWHSSYVRSDGSAHESDVDSTDF